MSMDDSERVSREVLRPPREDRDEWLLVLDLFDRLIGLTTIGSGDVRTRAGRITLEVLWMTNPGERTIKRDHFGGSSSVFRRLGMALGGWSKDGLYNRVLLLPQPGRRFLGRL